MKYIKIESTAVFKQVSVTITAVRKTCWFYRIWTIFYKTVCQIYLFINLFICYDKYDKLHKARLVKLV